MRTAANLRSDSSARVVALVGAVMCAFTVAANAETAAKAVTSAATSSITSDVIYGHKDGMALTYDVFRPVEPNGAGVIFMVSGGWFSIWVPPETAKPRFQPLLDEGFTVISVRHGSAPRYKVPDAVSDVRAAVRHVKANADAYGVDPGRLGVWGGSAVVRCQSRKWPTWTQPRNTVRLGPYVSPG